MKLYVLRTDVAYESGFFHGIFTEDHKAQAEALRDELNAKYQKGGDSDLKAILTEVEANKQYNKGAVTFSI